MRLRAIALRGVCPAWLRAGPGSVASGESDEIGARDGVAAAVACAVEVFWRRDAGCVEVAFDRFGW